MELICFDLDNTLVDSDKVHVLAFNKAFKKNNLPEVKSVKQVRLFGMVAELIVKTIFPRLSAKKIRKVVEDHNDFVVKETKKFAKPFPGVKAVLKKLKRDYQLGVVSNCSHKEIKAIVRAAGLDMFDILVGNDDVKHGKPCPDEILKAEKLTHLNAAYMVGDSPYDIIAGKKAKAVTVAVLTGRYSRKILEAKHPDYFLKSLKELPRILKK